MKQKHLSFPLEIKAVSTDETGTFEGYGAVFGNIDSHQDVIVPGAFNESLQTRLPAMVWQHNIDQPIGVYTEVKEDANGLYVKGQLCLDTQRGKEAYALLKQGALKGLSIGYVCEKYTYDEKLNVCFLNKIDLYEISLVTIPSNSLANVESVKSDEISTIKQVTERDVEKALRDVGLSQKEAKTVISKGFKALQRDVAEVEDTVQKLTDLKNYIKDSF